MQQSRLPAVSEIMVRDPVAVRRDTSAGDAARLMSERNIGCVVVCDDDGAVSGIFTERDLLRQVATRPGWETTPVEAFMTPNPITVNTEDTLQTVADALSRSYVRHLPVIEQGKLVGILSVRDMMRHRATFLEWLVRRQTSELEGKNAALEERDRLMQRHLEIAGRTQREMLPPKRFELPPLSLAVAFHPLDRVSGDYYDFAPLSPDRLGILIADASGHSVPAALVSVATKTAFHTQARKLDSPAAALKTMNEQLLNLIEAQHFVTMSYAVVDCKTLELTYAAAGHLPALWHRRKTGHSEPLDAEGLPLGVAPDQAFQQTTVQLDPGDVVLFLTDGVTESRNAEQELFGRHRVEAFLREQTAQSSEALLADLDGELARFRGSRPPEDDATCVVLSVEHP